MSYKGAFGEDEGRDEVGGADSNSDTRANTWVQQGRTFEEIASQRKADPSWAGIKPIEVDDFVGIAESNWAPGTILCYALAGKPHTIAMVHEVQAEYLPLIQTYVALGTCRLRGKFVPMPEYPLVYLGLGPTIRFIDYASNMYAIFECVMNFAEANFQDWVQTLETEKNISLHLMGPDHRHLVTGQVIVDSTTAAGIVSAVNQANSVYGTRRKEDLSFDTARNRFFQEYPDPLFWSL